MHLVCIGGQGFVSGYTLASPAYACTVHLKNWLPPITVMQCFNAGLCKVAHYQEFDFFADTMQESIRQENSFESQYCFMG